MAGPADSVASPTAMSGSYLIEPRPMGLRRRIAEFWRYRQLLRFFSYQNIRKFYGNTWLGWTWIPLRVVLNVAVRGFVFGSILGTPSNGIPYLLFFAVGLAAWELFAYSWYFATRSLELNRRYLKRIYVPRLIVLFASNSVGLLWGGLYTCVAAIVLLYYALIEGTMYLTVTPDTLLLIPGALMLMAMAMALGLWTSIFGGQGRRDPRFVVRQVEHVWFYLTPVIYPISLIPSNYQGIASVNPLTAPMEMIHLAVFGTGEVTSLGVLVSVGFILLIGGFGLRYFDASESLALDQL
jgi:lipopolysaccharide transport system permease protein